MIRRRKALLAAICLVLLFLLAGVVFVAWLFDRHLQAALSISVHEFVVEPAPAALTEDLAMEKARAAMTLDGCDPTLWKPYDFGPPEHYLNGATDRRASILFEYPGNPQPDKQRNVEVELKGNRLICQVSRGK